MEHEQTLQGRLKVLPGSQTFIFDGKIILNSSSCSFSSLADDKKFWCYAKSSQKVNQVSSYSKKIYSKIKSNYLPEVAATAIANKTTIDFIILKLLSTRSLTWNLLKVNFTMYQLEIEKITSKFFFRFNSPEARVHIYILIYLVFIVNEWMIYHV